MLYLVFAKRSISWLLYGFAIAPFVRAPYVHYNSNWSISFRRRLNRSVGIVLIDSLKNGITSFTHFSFCWALLFWELKTKQPYYSHVRRYDGHCDVCHESQPIFINEWPSRNFEKKKEIKKKKRETVGQRIGLMLCVISLAPMEKIKFQLKKKEKKESSAIWVLFFHRNLSQYEQIIISRKIETMNKLMAGVCSCVRACVCEQLSSTVCRSNNLPMAARNNARQS